LGLDRLMAIGAAAAVTAAGCGGPGSRPARLLDGRRAAELPAVDGSVVAAGRVVDLDGRADACLPAPDRGGVAPDTAAVERVGVDSESLTFANRDRSVVYACDGGIDPAGERAPPWCHTAVGDADRGRILDARLDVACVDRRYHPLAYAFVEPVPGARWIGVREDGYVELYEVLGRLPVRVATAQGVDADAARATLDVTQYDAAGQRLLHGELEAAVAG
jgi:hypothetical protein